MIICYEDGSAAKRKGAAPFLSARMTHVPASTLARELGFTPKYWSRLASEGKVPGAYQPTGPRGRWLFDQAAVRRWFLKSQRTREECTWASTGGERHIGRALRETVASSERPLKQAIDQWLAAATQNGPRDSRALAWGERPRVTFSEAVRSFVTEHLPQIKASSAKRYVASLKRLAELYEGLYLDQIDIAHLADFESLRRKQGVASPSIRRDLACLSSLMTHCEDKDWIKANPVPSFLRGAPSGA
jgi:hypothetical protein